MKLPQFFINEVLSRTDVVDVIKPRLTLHEAGKARFSALCPFHQEKSPSFSISRTKQFYYCFGCKANGNAISFLMAYEKLSFLEAVEVLATQAGMTMPKHEQTGLHERKLDLRLLEQSVKYYQQQLKCTPHAVLYLQQRGLSPDIISTFRLGFAPAGWNNLQNALVRSSKSQKMLLEVGMLVQKNSYRNYDRFRERIMFPIRNRHGETIAFGGRSLGSVLPKYLNSPETAAFHKSAELYGLFEALQSKKTFERMIIVEGYLDVIALHQHGLTETVATLGTAISLQHVQTLLRFTQSLLFCFDGDSAGKNAAWRALEITLPLMHTGINIQFLFLSTGEDPDSFIRKVGVAGFIQATQKASSIIDYFFAKIAADTNITTLAGKTRFVYMANKYLQKQPKGIFQELMYKRAAKIVGLSFERIQEILDMPQEQVHTERRPEIAAPPLFPPVRFALCLLLQCPKLLQQVDIQDALFTIEVAGMKLLYQVTTAIRENTYSSTGSLLEYIQDDREKSLLSALAAQDLLIPEEAWQKELEGAIARIKEFDIAKRIQSLMTKGKKEGLNVNERKLLQTLLRTRAPKRE